MFHIHLKEIKYKFLLLAYTWYVKRCLDRNSTTTNYVGSEDSSGYYHSAPKHHRQRIPVHGGPEHDWNLSDEHVGFFGEI